MTHRIIVCGIFRSGTSLLTKLSSEWGAYAGKTQDLFQDKFGYLEHFALQKLNDDLLDKDSYLPTPVDVLLEKAKDPTLSQWANQILAAMDEEATMAQAPAWVWKDPRLPLTIPFWADFWKDAIYIIPIRHPIETILSGAEMEGLSSDQVPLSAGLIYWQFCMLNILNFSQNNPRKIFIAFDQLLKDPQAESAHLCTFLDEQCGIDTKDKNSRIQSMISQIETQKYHHQVPTPLANVEVSTTEQRALYNFLRLKAIYPNEAFNANDFALPSNWMEALTGELGEMK